MSLKSELIEAMANEVLKKLKSEDSLWSYCSKTGKIRSVDLDGTFDVKSLLASALSAHSAFLAERGLKVVGREATRHQIKVMKGAVKRYNKSLGHGESASSEAFPTIYYESGVVAAPDLFAEAPDAR